MGDMKLAALCAPPQTLINQGSHCQPFLRLNMTFSGASLTLIFLAPDLIRHCIVLDNHCSTYLSLRPREVLPSFDSRHCFHCRCHPRSPLPPSSSCVASGGSGRQAGLCAGSQSSDLARGKCAPEVQPARIEGWTGALFLTPTWQLTDPSTSRRS